MTGTLLVLIGSGETSPTMVTVHRDLVTGTGVREPEAVLLATPYAFQVQVGAALRERILAGRGVTVLASAAAATAGSHTVPVYEIYKAGSAPGWLDGLDVLGPLGLDAAVIPHYDNAEGRYDQADAIRAALAEAGLHIQDTPDGPRTTTAE